MAPITRGKRKAARLTAAAAAKADGDAHQVESIPGAAAENVPGTEMTQRVVFEGLSGFEAIRSGVDFGYGEVDVYTGEDIFATPQATGGRTMDFSPETLEEPEGENHAIITSLGSHARTGSQNLLRSAVIHGTRPFGGSSLENARDIEYGGAENAGGRGQVGGTMDTLVGASLSSVEKGHPLIGGLRPVRRSSRINKQEADERDTSPSILTATVSKVDRVQKRVKKSRKPAPTMVSAVLRRSARLSKPLTEFHLYPELPIELQIMIWEAAITPRLTYICNRGTILSHGLTFGIQNKLPHWFMACRLSVYVAKMNYQKMFSLPPPTAAQGWAVTRPGQDINPAVDTVIFEPCHSGCRGYYCASSYSLKDRSAVRQLVVQIDSAHLVPSADPGWVTISRSWQNVETLFMMKSAIMGIDQREKAMIRVQDGGHEQHLRRGFDAWKKAAGRDSKMSRLEFVRVVERESGPNRYASVQDRLTGLPEDIIHG